jgi:hypothetical protein
MDVAEKIRLTEAQEALLAKGGVVAIFEDCISRAVPGSRRRGSASNLE